MEFQKLFQALAMGLAKSAGIPQIRAEDVTKLLEQPEGFPKSVRDRVRERVQERVGYEMKSGNTWKEMIEPIPLKDRPKIFQILKPIYVNTLVEMAGIHTDSALVIAESAIGEDTQLTDMEIKIAGTLGKMELRLTGINEGFDVMEGLGVEAPEEYKSSLRKLAAGLSMGRLLTAGEDLEEDEDYVGTAKGMTKALYLKSAESVHSIEDEPKDEPPLRGDVIMPNEKGPVSGNGHANKEFEEKLEEVVSD